MNVQIIISLIATIAYIPLFVILLSNRPWDRKQKFFFLFLITPVFWSFVTFLYYSDLIIQDKQIGINIITCAVFWMIVQLHYLILSFYQFERIKIPWAYLFLVAAIVIAASPDNRAAATTERKGITFGVMDIIVIPTRRSRAFIPDHV